MWKVYINGKYIGIKESNYHYAKMYWSEVARTQHVSVKLIKEVSP